MVRATSLLFSLCCVAAACNDSGDAVETDGGSGGASGASETGDGTEPEAEPEPEPCGETGCEPEACDPGTHDCAGVCVEDDSVDHCGDACEPCAADPSGVAICEAGACGLACDEGYAACEDGCCPQDTGTIALGEASEPSIALDAEGNPHVGFLVIGDGLHYATLDAGGWSVESIGEEESSESSPAIAVDPTGSPVVAYRGTYSIRVARPGGGGWEHETAYESSFGYGPIISSRSLVLDGDGGIHVAFHQEDGGTHDVFLRHAWHDGRSWAYETIEESDDDRYSIPSLKIAPDDTMHISWVSWFEQGLHHASGTTGSWTHEVALDTGRCCDDSMIALDGQGAPHVGYRDGDGAFVVAEPGLAPLNATVLHAPVTRVGDVAFDSLGALRYSLLFNADLVYGHGGDEETLATGVTAFMMTLDAQDRAHFVYVDDAGLRYLRVD